MVTEITDKYVLCNAVSEITKNAINQLTKEVSDMARPRKSRQPPREEPRYTVRGVRREKPDIALLARALLGLAIAAAEKQTEAARLQARQQLAEEHGLSLSATTNDDREQEHRDA